MSRALLKISTLSNGSHTFLKHTQISHTCSGSYALTYVILYIQVTLIVLLNDKQMMGWTPHAFQRTVQTDRPKKEIVVRHQYGTLLKGHVDGISDCGHYYVISSSCHTKCHGNTKQVYSFSG